jgi:hypothetical protein
MIPGKTHSSSCVISFSPAIALTSCSACDCSQRWLRLLGYQRPPACAAALPALRRSWEIFYSPLGKKRYRWQSSEILSNDLRTIPRSRASSGKAFRGYLEFRITRWQPRSRRSDDAIAAFLLAGKARPHSERFCQLLRKPNSQNRRHHDRQKPDDGGQGKIGASRS